MKKNFAMLRRLAVCAGVIMVGSVSAAAQQESFVPGYRASASVGYFWSGGGDENYLYAANSIQLETSHGYELSPHFYLGAGLGIHMFQEHTSTFAVRDGSAEIPFFANARLTVGKGKVNVLADLKAGVFLTEDCSKYLSGMLGLRCRKPGDKALTFSLGMESAGMVFQELNYTYIGGRMIAYGTDTLQDLLGFSFKIGYEF